MTVDLQAAFPSLSRAWMFRSFRAACAPTGLLNVLIAVHAEVWALPVGRLGVNFLYAMSSGVLQGCPLSGTVFAVSFDSPLRLLVQELGDAGIPLACADDVLAILRFVYMMATVSRVFATISMATGMVVNFKKCVAVPLWRAFRAQTKETLRTSLVRWAPSW